MFFRSSAFAVGALALLGCPIISEDMLGPRADAGPGAQTTAALLGKWGQLRTDGTADPGNFYYFATGGGWGAVSNGSCTAGDAFKVDGTTLSLRNGSTITNYQVSFEEGGALLRLRPPGSGDAAASQEFVFRLIDQATTHSCASL